MRTGFIGLGAMGRPMALRLHEAGLLQGVCNRSPGLAEQFSAETGCPGFPTPAELASECECVVLCVSADEAVLALVSELAGSLGAGGLIIDCSTTSAETARTAATQLAEQNIGFLDCPVSGGTEGAKSGTLAIMAGGNEDDFERARPVLEAMGKRITLMGPAGAGQATKAVNQVMVAGINQTVTEALAFAVAENLPVDKLIDTLGAGAASNWFLAHRGATMVNGEFPLGFKVSLHRKDLEICRAMAADHDVTLPMVEMTLLHYRRLISQGHADHDISSLYTLKQGLFDRARQKNEQQ